ncbi:phosphoesterase [Sporothrix brasiliensis 5110]|uniref:Phosphoesterase n=1 Tax=Sporothrix brasiliensis 5110 TaxID=1398154 RepID=A0A0C2FMN5_9PEZI|nr:phosphoesterase [Sporothrix brasiliensis 5110]KIH92333.1 phosphoesterase [Sporothrix brasiliensis 5110]
MASGLDSLLHRPRPKRTADAVSVVCISDTHNHQPRLPDGDVLIHAGDLTQSGSFIELEETLAWLRRQTHAVKIVVAGSHGVLLDEANRGQREEDERQHRALHWGDIVYLENDETTVTCPNGRRLRVYGSPLSPRHGNWAFQYPRAHDVWAQRTPPIPGTDVLITHSPPHAHLDRQLGCVHLLRTIWRVRPRLHVFGHVHDGAGTEWVQFDALQSAYEKTVLENGCLRNMLNLGRVLVHFVWLRIWPASETTKCLLVNAATVGGLRDDTLRQSIQVLL